MQEKILNQIDSDKLRVFVVWMPVLPGDSREKALASKELIGDGRAVHYWDGEKKLGDRYGTVIDLPPGWKLAWDIYFAFDSQTEWKETLPVPADWMHQLAQGERWLDGEKLHESIKKLLKAVKKQ